MKYLQKSEIGQDCVITIPAIADKYIAINSIYFSYSGQGTGTINIHFDSYKIFEIDVSGYGFINHQTLLTGNVNEVAIIHLSGIPESYGKLVVEYVEVK